MAVERFGTLLSLRPAQIAEERWFVERHWRAGWRVPWLAHNLEIVEH
jgi:hypothetical protein